jgi:beta-lactamase regulating signal transducer with metallopeptidase domain/archaellum component FlaC
MIGEALVAASSAVGGVWEILSDGRLSVLLATQATCCIMAGLAASYLWQRRAARAHQILLIGLLASVAMPASYLLVGHLGIGILTPQTVISYDPQQNEASAAEPATMSGLDDTETDAGDLFDDSLVFDPTEPDFSDAARVDSATVGTGTPWLALFVGGSLVTGMALFGRLLWKFILGRRLLSRAQLVQGDDLRNALEKARTRMGVAGPVQLRCSRDICSPLIWCWGRVPVLLVHEQTSRRLPRCDWVGIFCHELAHWKRLDHVTGLFCEVLLCAAPWNPLLWWAKDRLAILSEEACDDWAVAGGQVGVDYAESLLGLSPQAQMAFLPTVVGKEKAMKERICRILKDKCGDPQAGARWVILVAILAIGTSVTVALAQPRRPLPPNPDPFSQAGPANPGELSRPMPPAPMPPAQRPLAVQGRRNVINRMLENLQEQRRHVEMQLQEQGDGRDDQAVILRSELATIRNRIDALERQLQNVNQPLPPRPPLPGVGPGLQRPAAPIEQRLPQLQNRISQAEARLKQLEAQGQGDSEQAQRLRENLRAAREQMQAAQQQVNAQPPRPGPYGAGPLQQPAPARRRAQVQERIRQLEQELQIAENPQGEQAGQSRRELRQLRAEMRDLDGQAPPVQPAQPVPVRPQAQLQEQVQQLQNQMSNLNRQMEQMQRTLNQLVQQRPDGQPQQR